MEFPPFNHQQSINNSQHFTSKPSYNNVDRYSQRLLISPIFPTLNNPLSYLQSSIDSINPHLPIKMYTTQITAVALFAVASFIQPCPAPIAGIIGSILGGGSGGQKRDIATNLDKCIVDGQRATEHVRISGQNVVMEGVPASCLAEVKVWNDHPHSAALAKDYGTVKILDESAGKVEFDGLPQASVDLLTKAVKPSQ